MRRREVRIRTFNFNPNDSTLSAVFNLLLKGESLELTPLKKPRHLATGDLLSKKDLSSDTTEGGELHTKSPSGGVEGRGKHGFEWTMSGCYNTLTTVVESLIVVSKEQTIALGVH